MEEIFDYVKLGVICISFISTVIISIVNFRKSNKKVKEAEEIANETTVTSERKIEATQQLLSATTATCNQVCKKIDLIKQYIPEAIEMAEQQVGVDGKGKKTLAVAYLIQKCVELNINYSEMAQEISSIIESFITMTKLVNSSNRNENLNEKEVGVKYENY